MPTHHFVRISRTIPVRTINYGDLTAALHGLNYSVNAGRSAETHVNYSHPDQFLPITLPNLATNESVREIQIAAVRHILVHNDDNAGEEFDELLRAAGNC